MFYLNNLPLAIAENTTPSPFPTHLHGYADYTKINKAASVNLTSAAYMQIQDNVQILIMWLIHNNLNANTDKFKYMLIGTAAMIKENTWSVLRNWNWQQQFEQVWGGKNLGVVVDQNLKRDMHVKSIADKCNGKLIQLTKIRKCTNPKTFKNLVKVSYISPLDYCHIVYGNACKKELQRVQRSQNFAARVATKKQKYDSISSIISELGWLTMDNLRLVHRVNHIHKSLQGNAPQYQNTKQKLR